MHRPWPGASTSQKPDWPDTLTGVPRQVYEVWKETLQPLGYGLKAEIVDWPTGSAWRSGPVPDVEVRPQAGSGQCVGTTGEGAMSKNKKTKAQSDPGFETSPKAAGQRPRAEEGRLRA